MREWIPVIVLTLALGINVLWDWEQLETGRILGDRIDLVNDRVDRVCDD